MRDQGQMGYVVKPWVRHKQNKTEKEMFDTGDVLARAGVCVCVGGCVSLAGRPGKQKRKLVNFPGQSLRPWFHKHPSQSYPKLNLQGGRDSSQA